MPRRRSETKPKQDLIRVRIVRSDYPIQPDRLARVLAEMMLARAPAREQAPHGRG